MLLQNVFVQNQAELRNGGNDVMGLQANQIYYHINGLKTQQTLLTILEHVLMVKPLIYELLLCCHKWYQIF